MVRDPSDGSVKDVCSLCGAPPDWDGTFNCCRPELPTNPTIAKTYSASGLRDASGRADYQKRLEASREWLKEYKSRRASQGQHS